MTLRRGGPLRPESEKRRAQRGQREAVRRAALARDRGCVARPLVKEVWCWGPLDAHELLTRARGGDPLDLDNVRMLCRAHHDWCHDHPADAEERGLLRPSWQFRP